MPSSAPPRPASLWLPVLAYMSGIFALSSISHTPAFPAGTDKDLHALLYGGLGLLVVRALSRADRHRVTWPLVVATTVVCAVYGVSDEFHQSFVPLRQVDAWDVVADTVGGGIASLAVWFWARWSTRSGANGPV